MSKILYAFWTLVAILSVRQTLCAASLDQHTWASPDNSFLLSYLPVNVTIPGSSEEVQRFVLFLTEGADVKWIGCVETDGSAHNQTVAWAPNSKNALLVVRPNRAQCEVYLLDIRKAEATPLGIPSIVSSLFEENSDDDPRVFSKIWFGDWNWTSNSTAKGTINFAKSFSYQAEFELNVNQNGSNLKLLSVKKLTKKNL